MKTINVGVIGLGGISRVHIAAIRKLEGVNIAAVCDIKKDKLLETAKELGADPYENWQDVIARPDIDVIEICTPHYLHAPMAIAALKAGKHVLTEKPMASEIGDALEMIKTADECPGTLNVIFQNRLNASTKALKTIIDSGKAGKLICACASVCWHRTAPYYTESGWRGTWETEGGGALINQSIHTIDLLSYLGGPIKRLKGHISTDLLSGVIEVEDNCHAVFEYENGASGVFYATNNYGVDAPILLEMVFENGTYQLLAEKLMKVEDGIPTLIAGGRIATELGEKSYWGVSHEEQIRGVYEAIREGRQYPIDGRSAFPALDFVKAVYESSAAGKWVELRKV